MARSGARADNSSQMFPGTAASGCDWFYQFSYLQKAGQTESVLVQRHELLQKLDSLLGSLRLYRPDATS